MGGKERRLLTLVFPNAKKYGWIYELSFCACGGEKSVYFPSAPLLPSKNDLF